MPKITFISDTHLNEHRLTTHIKHESPDILVHCGDATRDGNIEELRQVADWFSMLKLERFVKDIVLVAGNHDRGLQVESNHAIFTDAGVHLLQDSSVSLKPGLPLWLLM